jgi:hypothetical protein
MAIITRESLFENQAKDILKEALKEFDIENLDDIDAFQDEIWKDNLAREIGRKFIEKLSEWNGEETFEEVMDELREENEDNDEE